MTKEVRISNAIGATGVALISLVWLLNLYARLEIALPLNTWMIYRHVLPIAAVGLTLIASVIASVKGYRLFWIFTSVFCAGAAWLFFLSRDL